MTVTCNLVGEALKEIRGEETQLRFGFDVGVGRESISKYENGRVKVPEDISRTLMDKFDNPKFAITIRNAYTGTGPKWLDGPNADLHRASVKEKSLEETEEAMEAIRSISFANPLNLISTSRKEAVAVQIGQAIIALEHLLAILCLEGNISYLGVWDMINGLLTKAGYTRG
ncbi:helix-turn-helix domain-containing protein [Lysinibacillus xylanilyticus]|uniref:helix-turn-helix domain-containing protein n=1 Tax=Lysinibacillus xylanilyticus TaxID=582475 RepID=UPI003CFF8900